MSDALNGGREPRVESTRSRQSAGRSKWGWWVGGVLALAVIGWWLSSATPTESQQSASDAATTGASVSGCSDGPMFYVAPDGQPGNDGSSARPWDLQTALSNTTGVGPCATVWLKGGTYKGVFESSLNGREGSPVMIRQLPGARATIDSAPTAAAALTVSGSWAWFMDFEIMNSDPGRQSSQNGGWPADLKRSVGVATRGSHLKFIDLVVHDLTRGFEIGSESLDTEVYGSLIYYNGWEGPNQTANGYGIDTHNRTGSRRLIDNVIFGQFSHGILAYSSASDPTNNIVVEGNILFNNGSLSRGGAERDLLIGGGSVALQPKILNNVFFGKAQTLLGLGSGCTGGIVTGNYFGGPVVLEKCAAAVTNNTLVNASPEIISANPSNTFVTNQPTGVTTRIRPSVYTAGRASVAILNWDRRPEVEVDLSKTGLTAGQAFEIRNSQDFYGAPVITGVYKAQKIMIPMGSLTVSSPVGSTPSSPVSTSPEFAALLVIPAPPSPPTTR